MSEVRLYKTAAHRLRRGCAGCIPCGKKQETTARFDYVVQGYLAHKKPPTPLEQPYDPKHRPTVRS
jgi:hypothetical protein